MPNFPRSPRADGPELPAGVLDALLSGGLPPEEGGTGLQPVAALLAALTAAPEDGELAGHARALAEFRRGGMPAPVRHPAHRRTRLLASILSAKAAAAAVAAAAVLGGVATAAYAGALPAPAQKLAHATIGAPSPHVSASPGAGASGHQATPTGPDASGHAAFGLCTAYDHVKQHGTAAQKSVAFRNLAAAAGGAANISSYCSAVPHPGASGAGQPSTHPSGQPSGVPSTHPSGMPTAHPSGMPTTHPSGQPTTHPSGHPLHPGPPARSAGTNGPAPSRAVPGILQWGCDMEVAIVYESLFGNTRTVAEAIADGIREADPSGQVSLLPVADAKAEQISQAELLIVGGPTHMRGMTSGLTRRKGLAAEEKAARDKGEDFAPEKDAAGPGVRDWFTGLPPARPGVHAAAFDTRGGYKLAGGAARKISRHLRGHGYDLAAKPEGFIIEGTEGPLREGEQEKAKAWGAGLVRDLAPAGGPG